MSRMTRPSSASSSHGAMPFRWFATSYVSQPTHARDSASTKLAGRGIAATSRMSSVIGAGRPSCDSDAGKQPMIE